MLKGMPYLKNKLALKSGRVLLRYTHYEMKHIAQDMQISTPPQLYHWQTILGWCAKAVDSLADRLVFREFKNDNFDLNAIFQQNNADLFFDSAILGALISSCDFAYIYQGDDRFPRIQVIDGGNATGIIDGVTNLLTEGYAVLERDDMLSPTIEAYFTPDETIIYRVGEDPETVPNPTGQCLLVPIIYRPDAVRPFGHSRISRCCMSLVDSAMRTVKRSEISAEFYSFPQKYVTGLSQDAEVLDKWRAAMSAMMVLTKDDEGDHPVVGQFQQETMTPHMDQLKGIASLFAGETGLTMDDLGFATENPSSAEAIKASHENLRLTARKAQRGFGTGFLNVGFVAACLRDGRPYTRSQLYQTKSVWEPVFEPDAAALSVIGDGANKINQAVPNYFAADNLQNLTGIEPSEEESSGYDIF